MIIFKSQFKSLLTTVTIAKLLLSCAHDGLCLLITNDISRVKYIRSYKKTIPRLAQLHFIVLLLPKWYWSGCRRHVGVSLICFDRLIHSLLVNDLSNVATTMSRSWTIMDRPALLHTAMVTVSLSVWTIGSPSKVSCSISRLLLIEHWYWLSGWSLGTTFAYETSFSLASYNSISPFEQFAWKLNWLWIWWKW